MSKANEKQNEKTNMQVIEKSNADHFFSLDIIWIILTVALFILVNGASDYIRSFFTAGFLQ